MQRESWRIERLDRLHDRSRFACGVEALDVFLRVLVTQYEKRCLGRTYVAVRGNARTVWGYYTIAAGSVRYSALPDSIGRKLPKHPVPTGLLARLAVDESVQGQGLGAFLLLDALARFSRLAEELGIHAVEVDAGHEQAQRFYAGFGFIPLIDDPRHMYLPIATIRDALGDREGSGSP